MKKKTTAGKLGETEDSTVDTKEAGKLGKAADEVEEIKKIDSKTYWKVYNDTGGFMFWIFMFASCIFGLYLWDQSDSFWTNFAALTSDEQKEHAVSWMTFICGVVFCQILMDIFKRSQMVKLEVKIKNAYFQKLLDRLIKAPVNLYFDITPVARVLGYFNEDLSAMDESLFN